MPGCRMGGGREEFDTGLRLWTAAPDLGRVQEAIPDIDELARQITLVSRK